jgi:hypothetical protein
VWPTVPVGGEVVGEPRRVEAEPDGDARHEPLAEVGHRVDPLEHCRPQLAAVGREQVRAMHRPPGPHARIVWRQLRAEVDALLAVGHARGQLTPDGEPAPPRPTGPLHCDACLLGIGPPEEGSSRGIEPLLQVGIDAVTCDQEEPVLAARPIDLARHTRLAGR